MPFTVAGMGIVDESSNRMGRLLFKMAVELAGDVPKVEKNGLLNEFTGAGAVVILVVLLRQLDGISADPQGEFAFLWLVDFIFCHTFLPSGFWGQTHSLTHGFFPEIRDFLIL